MAKSNRSAKKHKVNLFESLKVKDTKKKRKKFKCTLCERIVINPRYIKKRKNYPFGKKSKPSITYIHRYCDGILIELKKKKKDALST